MIDALNEAHGIEGRLSFRAGPGDLVCAHIESEASSGAISLHGGQVLSWTPAGFGPVVWLSETSHLRSDKPIRGGVPICWPWFGDHASDPTKPAHGFARTSRFAVTRSFETQDGCGLELGLTDATTPRALWPEAFALSLRIEMSSVLRIDLTMRNTSDVDAVYGAALHSYLQVGDSEAIEIEGLEGSDYLDKVEGFARKRQAAAPRIRGETDRVYLATASACTIHDPVLQRRLQIDKRGSRTTVLWNPGPAKARAMADFDDAGWRNMVCVESVNAFDDCVRLAPGAAHTLGTEIRAEAI